MPAPASATTVGAGGAAPRRATGSTGGAGLRQRKVGGSVGGGGGGAGTGRARAAGQGMWRFYTDDSPGIKVGPVPVLVMSLVFIASVFMLHIWGKYTRS